MGMLLLLGNASAGGGGGGGGDVPTMYFEITGVGGTNGNRYPINQRIFTVSTNVVIWMYQAGAAAIAFHKDGAKVGDGVEDVGDPGWFSYTWATGAVVDYDIKLTAVSASGTSVEYTVVNAEADRFTDNFSSWVNVDSCTITGGFADPDGGMTAYRVRTPASTNNARRIALSPSAASSNNWGMEIQVKATAAVPALQIALGGYACNIDLLTGQTSGTYNFVKIIERRDLDFVRLWVQRVNRTSNPDNTVYITLCDTLGDNTLTAAANSEIFLYQPRSADGQLPFTDYQRMRVWRSAVSGSEETWSFNHPFCDTNADMDTAAKTIQAIKPTGWVSTNTYKILEALPALTDGVETGAGSQTPKQTALNGDWANNHSCVVVIPQGLSGQPWYGKAASGSADHAKWMCEVLPLFEQEFLAGSLVAKKRARIGYSKSANAAFSLKMLYPDVSYYAAGWDGTWRLDRDWASEAAGFGAVTAFTTQANFRNYDPYYLMPTLKANVSEEKCLTLYGGYTFPTDQSEFKTLLDAEGVPYDYDYTLTAKHAWLNSWADAAVANMEAQGWV